MDKYLVSLAILLLLFEGLWLASDLNPSAFGLSSHATGQALGKIVKYKSQVRKRSLDSLIWEGTEKEQSVFAFDSILTLNESAAEIDLVGESHISLNENTMVVIEPPPDGKPNGPLRLRFKHGNMRASTAKEAQAVETEDFIVEATPQTKMNLRSVKPSGYEIETISGEVHILNSKTQVLTQVIKAGESASVSQQKVTRAPSAIDITWQKPVDNEHIYTHVESAVIAYLWQGHVNGVDVNGKVFEINPSNINGLTQKLSLGDYTVKLQSDGVATLGRSVHVWPAPKIYAVTPVYNQRFKKGEAIPFLWSQTNGVSQYNLDIAGDPAFKNIYKTVQTPDLGSTLANLPSGRWFWRVRGRDESGFEIPELSSKEFFVLDKPLVAPKLKQPQIKKGSSIDKNIWEKLFNLIISSAEAAERSLPKNYFAEFQWEKLEGAQGYVIEISDEPDFKNPTVSAHVKNENYKWKNFKMGQYYWRVAGEDISGQLGIYSAISTADLNRIPDQPITPFQVTPPVAKPAAKPVPLPIAVAPPSPPIQKPPPPPPPPPPLRAKYDIHQPWHFNIDVGGHGLYSRFQGGDFTAQDFGAALGDFRFILIPPPQKFNLWKGEFEFHWLALTARPAGSFPFQNQINASTIRVAFVDNDLFGFEVNQYLLFQRTDLESLGFQKLIAAGPLMQWTHTKKDSYYQARIALLLGQTYVADFSELYRVERSFNDKIKWNYAVEGRTCLGLTMNKDFWVDVGAYLWIGVSW